MRSEISSILSKYIPEDVVDICATWIVQKNIHLKITRERATKFGDYRPLEPGKGHRITVNHDLNKYAFLITFVHEVAHLEAYNKHKRSHEPHGKEWKTEFRHLLGDLVIKGVFPDDIRSALSTYLHNPAASSCSDLNLLRTLRKYDSELSDTVHVEDLPENTLFSFPQSRAGQVFRKGHKIRKRYHCLEVKSNKIYFVNPLAEVITVEG